MNKHAPLAPNVLVFLCAMYGTLCLGQTLSGRVYEGATGTEPPTAKALSGVTVGLYGSNDENDNGTGGGRLPIQTTATDSQGWYHLTPRGAYDFYNLVQTNKTGYVDSTPTPAATSVGGTVKSSNWIQYRYEDIFIAPTTATGNKFWDAQEGGGPPANQAPTAVDDTAITPQETAVDIYVLTNDTDPDGDPLHVNSATDPPHGTAVNHGTHVTYTPDSGFAGTDTFAYTAGDGNGGTDTATVTVTVEQGGPPPLGTGVLDGYKRNADTGAGLENWRIYIDLNANGQWDPGEPNDLTDSNGYYRIGDVEPGTCRVCEEMQAGWEGDAPCVEGVVIVEGVITTQDFHNRRTETPGGQVDTFGMCLDVELILPDGSVHRLSLSGPATARTQVGPNGEASDSDADGLDDVATELVSLNLSGMDPVLGQVTMSLDSSPGVASAGAIEEFANNTPGVLDIAPFTTTGTAAGFFDVWFQIDVPGWGTLLSSQPKRLEDVINHLPPGTNAYSEVSPTTIDLLDQNSQSTGVYLGPIRSCGSTPPAEDEYDFGDAPDSYGTLRSSGGAYHDVDEVLLGSLIDAEADGPSGPQADGDDNLVLDDEDGVSFAVPMAVGGIASVIVDVTAPIGVPAAVTGWVDFDHSGTFEDPAERILGGTYTGAGATVPWTETFQVPATALGGETYMRFRIYRTEPGVDVLPSPTGYGGEGEVEDYRVYLLSDAPGPDDGRDYGDAPLPYPAASHSLGGPYSGPFGDAPDAETGMQRDAQATGDDNDAGGDDENGLVSINLVKTGGWSHWEIRGCFSSNDVTWGLWVDLNGDGDWDDSGELISTSYLCGFGAGPQACYHLVEPFQVPADAKVGLTYARLRVYGGCNAPVSPSGAGGPGEVEDYLVEIKADGPGVPPGGIVHGFKWNDINANGLWDILSPVEPALAGWTIWLDTNGSGKQDVGDMTTQTDGQGHFRFAGVPAGTYTLGEELQPGWTQTTPGGAGTYTVTVQPGQGTYPQMFGNRQSSGTTGKGQICGSKWNDLNGNGLADQGEPYLSGWTVCLDLNHNGQTDAGEPTQITDAGGAFLFTGLAVGSYTVAEEMQPGWRQTWPGPAGVHVVNVQPGGAQPMCVLFGNRQGDGPGPNPQFDWGDAPDPMYPTLRASNGAYHVIVPGFHLGPGIDAEPDGQSTVDALGDDRLDGDDEDGVFFLTPLLPGQAAEIEVIASAVGIVDAWIDFDADGSWSQVSDRILQDAAVAAGSNVLSFQVPVYAATDVATYARLRFSAAGVSAPDGPAQDGEVEDYHILLGEEGPAVSGEGEVPHVKWSQPPIEIDPNADPNVLPVFCAWNEAARSTQQTGSRRQWRMDADDFRCLGPVPITRIRWWGGYKAWTRPEPPDMQPVAWHIGFWANQVEGLTPDDLYLERLVWSVEIPNERVDREPVGLTEFPETFPEMCFAYELRLEPGEWFHQAEFPSHDGVFWISITAVYPPDAEPVNQWGWTTRPHVWRDGAVTPAIMGEWPTSDERLFPGRIYPIERSAICGQNQPFDLCFELLTERPWIKWDQPFTGLRQWPHYQDERSGGVSIRGEEQLSRLVADDWICARDAPVVAAAWQGSYRGYGYEACQCEPELHPPRPDYFLLQVRADAGQTPGDIVWEYRAYDYDEVLVGFDKNPESDPNEPVFRYSVALPPDPPLADRVAPGGLYWFSVAAVYTDPLPRIVHPWGWTNHRHGFEAGVVAIDYTEPGVPAWRPLRDPEDRPVDMSFTLLTLP